jgi:acetoacetate decarboxylase
MFIVSSCFIWDFKLGDNVEHNLKVLAPTHIIADLTLGLGKVVYDYLKPEESGP